MIGRALIRDHVLFSNFYKPSVSCCRFVNLHTLSVEEHKVLIFYSVFAKPQINFFAILNGKNIKKIDV